MAIYTPNELARIYTMCKIKHNPCNYSLADKLIESTREDIAKETILSYGSITEHALVELVKTVFEVTDARVNSWSEEAVAKPVVGSITGPQKVATRMNNLHVDVDMLREVFGFKSLLKFKESCAMEAFVRMCVALTSEDSCTPQMFWLYTEFRDTPYEDLLDYAPLKKALLSENPCLPVPCAMTEIIHPKVPRDINDREVPMLVSSASYAIHMLEVLWAYVNLNDARLKEFLTPHFKENAVLQMFTRVTESGEIVPTDEVQALIEHKDPKSRFEAYRDFTKNLTALATDVHNTILKSVFGAGTLVLDTLVSLAQTYAIKVFRVTTVKILYRYCAEHHTLDTLKEAEDVMCGSAEREVFSDMLKDFEEARREKGLVDLDKRKLSYEDVSKPKSAEKSEHGADPMLVALDSEECSFKCGRYSYDVADVHSLDDSARVRYEAIAAKVSLVNKALIKKIRAIKTYNTGGKDAGKTSGRVDRKAIHRYKCDKHIFYDNTYKVLESDLAFGIVLDVSGSMHGEGIDNGRITMIVLHETLKALGINHCIITHTCYHGDYSCRIERYQAFREDRTYRVRKNYGIARIEARAGNCDSGALYYMERAFERVHNKDKVCLVFSDGAPTECTGQDLIDQVKHMERNGIKVIGIGIDFPNIAKYYTEYANGRNLKDMLDIVTRILQEYILKKEA